MYPSKSIYFCSRTPPTLSISMGISSITKTRYVLTTPKARVPDLWRMSDPFAPVRLSTRFVSRPGEGWKRLQGLQEIRDGERWKLKIRWAEQGVRQLWNGTPRIPCTLSLKARLLFRYLISCNQWPCKHGFPGSQEPINFKEWVREHIIFCPKCRKLSTLKLEPLTEIADKVPGPW